MKSPPSLEQSHLRTPAPTVATATALFRIQNYCVRCGTHADPSLISHVLPAAFVFNEII